MSWNDLGTGDCTALAEAIKHYLTVRELDFTDNGLGTADCTVLAEAIKHNSTITQLKFDRESTRYWRLYCTVGSNQTQFNNNSRI